MLATAILLIYGAIQIIGAASRWYLWYQIRRLNDSLVVKAPNGVLTPIIQTVVAVAYLFALSQVTF